MRISGWSSDVCSSDLALGRAHLDDAVDIPPIHAQVQRGSGDQPAQLTRRHGRFHLPPRLPRQAAMMDADGQIVVVDRPRSEEHTSELQSLMRISYAVFCLKKKNTNNNAQQIHN